MLQHLLQIYSSSIFSCLCSSECSFNSSSVGNLILQISHCQASFGVELFSVLSSFTVFLRTFPGVCLLMSLNLDSFKSSSSFSLSISIHFTITFISDCFCCCGESHCRAPWWLGFVPCDSFYSPFIKSFNFVYSLGLHQFTYGGMICAEMSVHTWFGGRCEVTLSTEKLHVVVVLCEVINLFTGGQYPSSCFD